MAEHELSRTNPDDDSSKTEGRSFHFFKYPESGAKVLESLAEPDGTSETIEEFSKTTRQEIIERYSPDIEGLDIERINRFMDDLGLRKASLLVVDRSKKDALNEYVFGITGTGAVISDHQGWYSDNLDVAIVFRDRDQELHNGAEYTESLIVHELAHGSSAHRDTRVFFAPGDTANVTMGQPRQGQAVSNTFLGDRTGSFLEEGFAEQLRARYVTEVLDRKRGFTNLPADWGSSTNAETGVTVKMATKYLSSDAEGNLKVPDASYAGVAMDLLIGKDPELFPALIRARRNADGLREVAQRIEAIHPGLYRQLRDDFNAESQFVAGLVRVSEVV